jgi:hypothetical protein
MNFIVVADPAQTGLDGILARTYQLYADFVLKNPFYSLDMPVAIFISFSLNLHILSRKRFK